MGQKIKLGDRAEEHPDTTMPKIGLSEARAKFSALVEDAHRGRATVITRRGRPRAVILGIDEWESLQHTPSFGELLMSAPIRDGDLPERDTNPPRDPGL